MRDRPDHPGEPEEPDRPGDGADRLPDQHPDQPMDDRAPSEVRTWADFEIDTPDEDDEPEPLGELWPEPTDELADDVALLRRDLADGDAELAEADRGVEPGQESDARVVTAPAGEAPHEDDRPVEIEGGVDRPDFQDTWAPHPVPDRYGDPLREGRDAPVPLFDGEPRREDTKQGQVGDCGVIAVLGAVAGHRPETLKERVRENDDGTYEVTLFEATHAGDAGRSEPTGRTVRMTVTPDLPVFDDAPDWPAFAKAERAACPAVLEKAAAGVDET